MNIFIYSNWSSDARYSRSACAPPALIRAAPRVHADAIYANLATGASETELLGLLSRNFFFFHKEKGNERVPNACHGVPYSGTTRLISPTPGPSAAHPVDVVSPACGARAGAAVAACVWARRLSATQHRGRTERQLLLRRAPRARTKHLHPEPAQRGTEGRERGGGSCGITRWQVRNVQRLDLTLVHRERACLPLQPPPTLFYFYFLFDFTFLSVNLQVCKPNEGSLFFSR